MAKKQQIVIKKIIVQGGGHHGGSWKVALADFMTAMMAFFLVMWLMSQSDQTKKAISDYFSTPSVIEYNFQNFGAEITLEKLFLDFVNEPLKAMQSFMEPSTKSPNVLDMGSEKVVAAYMADKMTDIAKNVEISQDGFDFDIPDVYLFERGSSQPKVGFVDVMDKLTAVTAGLKDAEIKVTSALFIQLVPDQKAKTADKVALERLALVTNKVNAAFDSNTNTVVGATNIKDKKGDYDPERLMGFIRVSIRQKEVEGKKRRKLESLFGDTKKESKLDLVPQEKPKAKPAPGADPNLNLINPVDIEVMKLDQEFNPGSNLKE
ncbi:flagellar motor protein MotB [Pseudobdellovibrio sp. HCB154]|uniref:OmpA/MotB family protein n=1 Tax=Pseudobdellovibrio sp. HCB154 TaxID=3386277 RepID=UPI0039175579